MHFRRAIAEQCTCSCWPSGSRRSVFLAFDDITLGECQPWKSPAKLQSRKPRLSTSPWARGLSRLASKPPCFLPQRSPRHLSAAAWFACCFPQSFIVSVYSSALNVSAAAIDRYEGDHADLPVGQLALFSCSRRRACWTNAPQFRASSPRDEVRLSFSEPLELSDSGLYHKLRKFAPPLPPRRLRITF